MSTWMNLEEGSIDEILLSFCKLWAAVLDQAVNDALGIGIQEGYRERLRIMSESREWILSNRKDPGSFRWICEALELDPKARRKSIFREIEKKEGPSWRNR